MGLESLRRAELATIILGLVAGGLVAALRSPIFGAGIATGAAWGAANLWALAGLLRQEIRRRSGTGSRRSYLLWSLVKFPVLYGGGYMILSRSGMPAEALLLGLSTLFFVWAAEAMWRSFGTVGQPAGGKNGT